MAASTSPLSSDLDLSWLPQIFDKKFELDEAKNQALRAKVNALFAQVNCLDLDTQAAFIKFWKRNNKIASGENSHKFVILNSHNLVSLQTSANYEQIEDILSRHLLDSKYVQHIMTCYSKHLLDGFYRSPYTLRLLNNWLTHNYAYLSLGSYLSEAFPTDLLLDSDFMVSFRKECSDDPFKIIKEIIESEALVKKLHAAVTAFLHEVSNYDSQQYLKAKSKAMEEPALAGKKIVIITTRNGGAHLSQASAMREFLTGQGYRVDVIEMQSVSKEYDPLYKNAIKFDDGTPAFGDEIYNKLEAQKKDQLQASFLRSYTLFLNTQFPDLYPKNAIREIIKKIRRLQPDLLINNLPYENTLASVPYRVNVPIEIIHCDYDFHELCIPHILRQFTLSPKVQLTGFGVACGDPEIFPKGLGPEHPSIHVVGFPTRSPFTPITDVQTIKCLRQKYQVPDDHIVYSISRGLLGALKHLKECVDDLITAPSVPKRPITVVVVCGENKESKAFLEQYTKDFPKPGKLFKFVILGLLNATEMNEVFQISDISDLKSGGGMTQEFLVSVGLEGSSRRAIVSPAYAWEICNALYLERTGLAKLYLSGEIQKDKVELVNELIGQPPLPAPIVDWRKALLNVIITRIKDHSSKSFD